MKRSILIGLFLVAAASPVMGQTGVINHVKVITVLASNDTPFIDPQLSSLHKELQSVFRYSSYRLLTQSSMDLKIGQTGTATLPGNRALTIAFLSIDGNRAQLKLGISKNAQSVFETVVQLMNGGTITVGGPQHEGGYLLFNISNSF